MEETHKTEVRNYLMAGGFVIIATLYFLMSLPVDGVGYDGIDPMLSLVNIINVGALLLVVVGIMLAAFRKRDLTAITFLMIGAMLYLIGQTRGIEVSVPAIFIGIFLVILAAIILVSKDKKKYLLFLIPGIIGVRGLLMPVTPQLANSALNFLFGLLMLYFAFACASERIRLPCGKILTADVETDFRANGSVIGYVFFGLNAAIWTGLYLCDSASYLKWFQIALKFDAIAGIMLVILGILLLVIGKMKFTPVMFIIMGFLLYVSQFANTVFFEMVIGAIFIVVGIFAILRTESRILPGIMVILYGLTYFTEQAISIVLDVSSSISPMLILVPVVLLNGIIALISVYIAFAVFSSKKLPLF